MNHRLTWMDNLQTLWEQRSPRERRWLSLGTAFVCLTLVWRIGLAPALQTWHEAPTRQALLDQQSRQMHQLQAQAQSLRKQPAISRNDAIQWLENHLGELGPQARLSLQAEHMSLTVQAAPAEQLAQWLVRAREQAHARPVQAQLQQTPAPAANTAPLWSGKLLLRLP